MIGHYDHIIEWATWALEQTASWPDAASPAPNNDAQIHEMLAPGLATWPARADVDGPTAAEADVGIGRLVP